MSEADRILALETRIRELEEALPTLVQHAYEEGVEDCAEWDDKRPEHPLWIDSVARVNMLTLLKAQEPNP